MSGHTTAATAPDTSPAVAVTPTALVTGTRSATTAQVQPVSPAKPTVLSSPGNTAASMLAALSSAVFGSYPGGPAESPLSWMVLAAARRFGAPSDAAAANRAAVVTTAAVTATNLDPAVATPIIGAPDPTTGTVSGQVIAADPEGKSLSYALKTGPAAGTLSLNKTLGSFTYTPTTSQRVLAQLTAGVDANQFTVTVSDGINKVDTVVTVAIAPVPVANLGQVAAGNGATGFAVTNTRAYVANRSDNTVTVVDTVNRAVIANITVGSHPSNVTVTPDGKRVYVTNLDSNSVSVIDTATNTKIADITVGANPYGIAVSPDGKTVYVTNRGAGTVSKISTATNKVTGTVTNVGDIPSTIVVTPDGKKIFVVNTAADYVSVFSSTATKAAILPTETGHLASAVAVNPAGTKLYVAGYSDGKVTVFDTKTNAVVDQFNMGGKPGGLAFSKDGSLLLVVNNDGTVQVRDTATKTVLTTVAVSGTTLGGEGAVPRIGVSPDGMQAYVSDATGRVLRVISLVPTNTRPVAGSPSVGTADPVTGAVHGVITANDADQDKLVYTAGPALKGKLTLNSDGTFTYVPSAAARHAAAASGATTADKTESFTITVSDGRRGVVDVQVSIAISPINTNPTVKMAMGKPNSSTGVVTGTLTGSDADKDVLFYTAPITTAKGTVTVDAKGKITFTPNATARHAAAALNAAETTKTDTFTVTVSDAHGGVVTVPVTVVITPANAKPANASSIATQADLTTGVVTGTVKATDTDGDTLTYGAPITTKKGSVVVNANGSFTYTPNATALAAAQATGASAATKTDTFTMTVADGYGGVSTATISVRMVPNRAPVIAVPTAGTPNGATGIVTGKVTATDPDGDKLTYSGSGTTSKGAVVVKADGTFTFTPTATARLNAGAGSATVTDSFTVTVSDGFGGTSTVTVTPTVDPARHIVTGSIAVGGAPSSVVLNRDGTRAYVANYADGTVSVVNSATNTVIGSPIKLGILPQAMSTNADGSRLYVVGLETSTYAGRLTVVNTVTNKIVGTPIDIGAYPTGIAVSPNGSRVYVTNGVGNTVTVVDTATGARSGNPIPVGDFPTGIALTPDGTRAYVTNGRGNTVSVIDTATGALVGSPIAVGVLPTGITFNASGTRAYVANANSKTITVVNIATNATIGSPIALPANPLSIAISPDGARLYVGGVDGSMIAVDTTTGTVLGSPLQLGGTPMSVAVSPDGSRIYVPNGERAVNVVSTSSTVNAPVAPIAPPPTSTAVSGAVTGWLGVSDPTKLTYTIAQKPQLGSVTVKADGSYIYTPTAAARQYAATAPVTDVFVVTATNPRGAATSVTVAVKVEPLPLAAVPPKLIATIPGYSTPYDVHSPIYTMVSPTGRYAYTINSNRTLSGSTYSSITVVDTITNTVVGMPTQTGFVAGGAALIPNGRYVYISDTNDSVSIVDTLNNAVVSTIRTPLGPGYVAASPDSTRVYVANYYSGVASISVFDATGRTLVGSAIPISVVPRTLIVSPDSRRLYVLDGNAGKVTVIDTNSRTVAGSATVGAFGDAELSADGRKLYLASLSSTGVQVLDLTSTTPTAGTPITTGNKYADKMVLSSDGKRLFVTKGDGTLSVFDTATSAVVGTGTFGGNPQLVVATPDGTRVFIVSNVVDGQGNRSVLSTFDMSLNSLVRQQLSVGFLASSMTLSPDGTRLYITDPANNNLHVVATGLANKVVTAPGSTAELYSELRRLTDWPWNKSGVAMQVVDCSVDCGVGSKKKLIVYLGGTVFQDASSERNWLRNVPQYLGSPDSEVVKQIENALVTLDADTEIMFVGYSQGGLDAQNLAADWVLNNRKGRVTTVAAFASPVNKIQIAAPYRTVYFMADWDPVPRIDFTRSLLNLAESTGMVFHANANTPISDVHGNPQTYINVGDKFDDPTNADANTAWFRDFRANLAKFRGKLNPPLSALTST
ncbi:hypothetical protein ASD37_24870 [Mycobacterium sp. Root135]|nr:hypothetical protein ASD37_24870 [Mycobacterium sp. Root135]